mgnify:CR=1 FL=1
MLKKINLKNKTALVTGAGKGLGKACAIALAEAGAKVIILSRTKSDLIRVNKIIKKTKGSSQLFVCDVTNLYDLKKVLRKISRLDILVNNDSPTPVEGSDEPGIKKNEINADFISEEIVIRELDYYYTNSISRSSKTMSECRQIRQKTIKDGTNN